MNAAIIVDDVISSLRHRYGKAAPFGRSRLFRFGHDLTCSVNYSKLLGGHRYFFGIAPEVVDSTFVYPETSLGEFAILVCGSADNVLVLPRSLIMEMMQGVSSRRIDVLREDSAYIMQTTRHP